MNFEKLFPEAGARRRQRFSVRWLDEFARRRGICELQDDMVVANAAGATVRADINAQLQSLATLSSGASAPGTIYANQLWIDTTTSLAKKRNNSNNGWYTFASKDFNAWLLDDGAVGAPAYSFNGDTDSGMYRIGANNIGWAVNGVKAFEISTTGLTIVGSLTAATHRTATGATASLAASAAETIFVPAAYGVYLLIAYGAANDAWRGAWIVRSAQNDPNVTTIGTNQYISAAFSGANLQLTNAHGSSAQVLNWAYMKLS